MKREKRFWIQASETKLAMEVGIKQKQLTLIKIRRDILMKSWNFNAQNNFKKDKKGEKISKLDDKNIITKTVGD